MYKSSHSHGLLFFLLLSALKQSVGAQIIFPFYITIACLPLIFWIILFFHNFFQTHRQWRVIIFIDQNNIKDTDTDRTLFSFGNQISIFPHTCISLFAVRLLASGAISSIHKLIWFRWQLYHCCSHNPCCSYSAKQRTMHQFSLHILYIK